MLKAFLATFGVSFDICCLVCQIQPAYEYLSSSLWPCSTFFKLKITNIFKSSGWGLEKSELPWKQKFLMAIGVLIVELLAYQVSMVCAAN